MCALRTTRVHVQATIVRVAHNSYSSTLCTLYMCGIQLRIFFFLSLLFLLKAVIKFSIGRALVRWRRPRHRLRRRCDTFDGDANKNTVSVTIYYYYRFDVYIAWLTHFLVFHLFDWSHQGAIKFVWSNKKKRGRERLWMWKKEKANHFDWSSNYSC